MGLIGAGWWATEYHIPGILSQPEAEIIALCDPNPERLANAIHAYSPDGLEARLYSNYQEMLSHEKLDAAIVITPHATHYPIAYDCLQQGLHVLVEKPLTLAAREARELVQLARAQNRQLMLGYTYHYFQHVQRARQAVLAGALGEIQYINSSFSSNVIAFLGGTITPENTPTHISVNAPGENYTNPDRPGGSGEGHLQLTHSTGVMFYITGMRAVQVQALMNHHGLPVDLVDAFSVLFDNGALGLVGGTGNAGANHRMALAIYGTSGCYLSDTLTRSAILRSQTGKEEVLDWGPSNNQQYAVDHNFIEVIQGRGENHAPGEIGWRSVELLDAAYRSAQLHGQPVTIEELYR